VRREGDDGASERASLLNRAAFETRAIARSLLPPRRCIFPRSNGNGTERRKRDSRTLDNFDRTLTNIERYGLSGRRRADRRSLIFLNQLTLPSPPLSLSLSSDESFAPRTRIKENRLKFWGEGRDSHARGTLRIAAIPSSDTESRASPGRVTHENP